MTLHRAIPGSFERFVGILIWHHAGNLLLWLVPRRGVVASITCNADGYAREVRGALDAARLRAELDSGNEKVGYQVREHSPAKVPALPVVGRCGAEHRQIAARRPFDRSTERDRSSASAAVTAGPTRSRHRLTARCSAASDRPSDVRRQSGSNDHEQQPQPEPEEPPQRPVIRTSRHPPRSQDYQRAPNRRIRAQRLE